jgi:PAS domain S-box-containing protein
MSSADHLSELESLRSQVAALTRQVAERDHTMEAQGRHLEQTMQDLQEQSYLLRTIIEGTAADTGDEFFASLVTHLTATLKVQYAIVGEVVGDETKILRTLAVSAGGALIENIEYALEHAPCGTGLDSPFWCFEQGVQARFPHFPNLATLGVESHCGVSLRNKAGEVVGLLIVMDTKPLRNSDRLKSLMEVFASRASAELQRYRAEVAQRDIDRRLQFTQYSVDHAVDGVLWADESQRLVYANEAARRALGYSIEELLTLSISDIVPHHDPSRFQQRLDQLKQGAIAPYESVHRRKDGTEFPVEVSVNYLEHQGRGYTCGLIRDITERKRIEEERQQALRDRQNIMETIPDILFTLDCAGNLVNWNSRLEAVTGYTPAELLNKPALHFVPAEEQAPTTAAIQRAFTEGYAELHGHMLTKEQCLIPYHLTGALLKNPHGEPIGITGIGRDVSDKKRVEEALRESEQRYRSLIDLSPNGLFVYCNGVKVYVNQAACTILGATSPEQLIENPTFHIAHPDMYESIHTSLAQILATGEPVHRVERKYQRLDGTAVFVEVDAGRIMWNGEPAIQVIFADITERKLIQEKRYQSESQLRAILDNSPSLIFLKDCDGRYLKVNREFEKTFHLTSGEIIGRADREIFSPEQAALFHMNDKKVLEGGMPLLFEEVTSYGNDTHVAIVHKFPLRDKEGTLYAIGGIATDITERKRVEEALVRFKLTLDQTHDCVFMFAPDTLRFIYCNRGAVEQVGYSEAELSTMTPLDIKPEFTEQSFRELLDSLRDGRKSSCVFETVHRHKDGYTVAVEISLQLVREQGMEGRFVAVVRDITERKQAQDALAQSEHQLRTVLDALPVGVWFTDRAGKSLLANPAAKQIWSNIKQIGLQTENPQAGWWETIGPTNEPHRWALSHVLTTGVPSQYETFDFECLDGTKKTIRNSTVPVKSEDGVILGAIMLNEDITTLRQAQAALQLTQFSVDHAVEGFLWVGSDARVFHVNDSICRMLEYTWEELTAMTLHDIDPNLTSEVWPAHWEEVKEKGSLTFESKYWSRTGRVLDMEVTVNYLQYEGKEYNCTIMRDIGERKRAEEVLRNSEERFTKAFLASSHLIGITEFETGCCVDVNDACLEMFGYRREEVIGQSTITLRLWPSSEDRGWLLGKIKADGMIRNLERSIIAKNGEVRQIVISSDPIQINGITCLLTVGHDVTERKRMEEALRQRERDLRAAIEERERISQDLHDGILQSLFAVGLSLETTKSMMSLKERKTSGPALKQAIDQLNRLMHEVRNFIAGLGSDLLQGKDLPTALHHMLKTLTKNHPTRVRLKVEDRAAQALSAEQSLHLLLVIQEAVSNCIRHGHAQEATVSLKLLKQGVRLSVRDNGCGFDSATSKGTGHGLANMATRAQKIGGRFTVLSKTNGGTRVVLDLPKEAALAHS